MFKRKNILKSFTIQPIAYLILGGWTLFVFFAIGWIFISSLSTTKEIFTNNLLDSGIHIENYITALTTHKLGLYFINSVIYVGVASLLIVVVAAPAAYALSRFQFRGKGLLYSMFISGMGIPGLMLIIPLFMLFLRLNLTGTTPGLIIIYVGLSIPFSVFLLTGFFSSLPSELNDAAMIDGCSESQAFWRVMLPIAQPGIITLVIFNFIGLWNDYLWALVFVNTDQRRTLMLGVEAIMRSMRYTGNWAGMFAGIIILFLPTFILFVLLSETIISGITAGAVKT
ncbi:MAG: carbohydrate ABC transporter permease [Chloroflexota bacterium]|nr:carbohydrate ABC transporter permease [Chloroflexota bacterium]